MKLALLGGAGRLGGWLQPWLATHHELTIFDPALPPGAPGRRLNALDRAGLAAALVGHDAVVHLCSVVPRGRAASDPATLARAWSVNVGSVATAMLAAHDAGIGRFAHFSTLSVFASAGVRRLRAGEQPDSLEPYGLSKRAGERTCSALAEQLGMAAVSLRLGWPTSDQTAPLWLSPATGRPEELWLADGTPIPALPARRVAEWLDAGLAGGLVPGHRAEILVADPGSVLEDGPVHAP